MIRYFKELERPNDFCLPLLLPWCYSILLEKIPLPISFYQRYAYVFNKINEINLYYKIVNIINNKPPEFGTLEYAAFLERDHKLVLSLIDDYFAAQSGLDYEQTAEVYDFFDDAGNGIRSFDRLSKQVQLNIMEVKELLWFYSRLVEYIPIFKDIRFQKEIKAALKEVKQIEEIAVHHGNKPVEINLPNAWYILPKLFLSTEYLYNTTGENGHKEANLVYDFVRLLHGGYITDPMSYFKKIIKACNQGSVTRCDFDIISHGILQFPTILPSSFGILDKSDENKRWFEICKESFYHISECESHNRNIVNTVVGCWLAHFALNSFFADLEKYASNYEKELAFLRKLPYDDILVRCCGFHKVTTGTYFPTIVTSSINWEEEFEEYIKNGWSIDFVNPIYISQKTGTLVEYPEEFLDYPEEFLLVKEFHRKAKNLYYC